MIGLNHAPRFTTQHIEKPSLPAPSQRRHAPPTDGKGPSSLWGRRLMDRTISMAIFNSYLMLFLCLPEGIYIYNMSISLDFIGWV